MMSQENTDKKISMLYPLAWGVFLLVPGYAFYTGFRNHSALAMGVSGVAMAGFITLIVLALRHNRRLARKAASR